MAKEIFNIQSIKGYFETAFDKEQICEINESADQFLDIHPDSVMAILNSFGEPVEMLLYRETEADGTDMAIGDGFMANIISTGDPIVILGIGPYTDPRIREKYFDKLKKIPPFSRRLVPLQVQNSLVYRQ